MPRVVSPGLRPSALGAVAELGAKGGDRRDREADVCRAGGLDLVLEVDYLRMVRREALERRERTLGLEVAELVEELFLEGGEGHVVKVRRVPGFVIVLSDDLPD